VVRRSRVVSIVAVCGPRGGGAWWRACGQVEREGEPGIYVGTEGVRDESR
jgi:hypothetical protein